MSQDSETRVNTWALLYYMILWHVPIFALAGGWLGLAGGMVLALSFRALARQDQGCPAVEAEAQDDGHDVDA